MTNPSPRPKRTPRSIPDRLRVLLVGGGGREHALAWRLAQSPTLDALFTTHPGNPGLAALAQPIDHDFSMKELYRVEQFIRREKINLVVVGPEGPLAEGIVDKLTSDTCAVFGPTKDAAQIEADKAWAKQVMRSASVPTPDARIFKDAAGALAHLEARETAPVIKATGLAAGKGVFVPKSLEEAAAAIHTIMDGDAFGNAGREILIEERLQGPEVSVFALTDGRNILILDACQDHKRLGEGDSGPNTGGMGAYCPVPEKLVDARMMETIQREIIVPTIDALRRDDIEYRGVLYAGLMLTHAGPKVLEFNARFGDPECQCLVRRMTGDFARLLYATATGQLASIDDFDVTNDAVVCIVLASAGYPEKPTLGTPITGIAEAEAMDGITIFHAGTRIEEHGPKAGQLVTAGGRVLNVVATAATIADARAKALAAAELIQFAGKQYRKDIAWQAVGEKAPAAR